MVKPSQFGEQSFLLTAGRPQTSGHHRSHVPQLQINRRHNQSVCCQRQVTCIGWLLNISAVSKFSHRDEKLNLRKNWRQILSLFEMQVHVWIWHWLQHIEFNCLLSCKQKIPEVHFCFLRYNFNKQKTTYEPDTKQRDHPIKMMFVLIWWITSSIHSPIGSGLFYSNSWEKPLPL